jgi:cell division septation protein DedD
MEFKTLIKFGLLAGVFFGAGFWYAKLSKPKGNTPVVIADSLEERQAEYEKIQEKLRLSYYDDLSKQPRRAAFDPEQTREDVPAQVAASPAAPQPPQPAQEPEPEPAPVAPKVEEQKPSSDHLAKALSKVLGKETPDSVESAAKAQLPSGTGSAFAVQVASLPDRKVAEQLANRLTAKGYDARLVQADIAGRGVVYRVRIHGYGSRQEAEEARTLIAKQEKLDAITVAQ